MNEMEFNPTSTYVDPMTQTNAILRRNRENQEPLSKTETIALEILASTIRSGGRALSAITPGTMEDVFKVAKLFLAESKKGSGP